MTAITNPESKPFDRVLGALDQVQSYVKATNAACESNSARLKMLANERYLHHRFTHHLGDWAWGKNVKFRPEKATAAAAGKSGAKQGNLDFLIEVLGAQGVPEVSIAVEWKGPRTPSPTAVSADISKLWKRASDDSVVGVYAALLNSHDARGDKGTFEKNMRDRFMNALREVHNGKQDVAKRIFLYVYTFPPKPASTGHFELFRGFASQYLNGGKE